ncbi:rhodanese-like domain-containing protein [Chloroflexota bacterium]
MRLKSILGLKSFVALTGSALIFVGACSSEVSNRAENISVQVAYDLIEDNMNNDDFVLLDIRTLQEYASGYIENAVNIDYYASAFQDDIDELDKDKTYLVYCHTANRSGQAMPTFENLGFEKVYNMLGGTVAWQAAGYPIIVP